MNNEVLMAIVFFLLFFVAGKFVLERGYRLLNDPQKTALFDYFSKQRKVQIVSLIGMILLFYAAVTLFPFRYVEIVSGYFVVIFIYLTAMGLVTHYRLRKIGLPAEFNTIYLRSQGLRVAGFLILMYLMFKNLLYMRSR